MAPAASSFKKLQRNENYYLSGGDIHFLAENHLFRVHRYFFERESPVFRDKLTLPASPGRTAEGTSDSNAIILDSDISAEEFERFLWVFYNPKYSLYETTADQWKSILELAYRWQFIEVTNLAVRELEKIPIEPIDRICLYLKYQVDEALLVPLYATLCAREDPLDFHESVKLGMKTVVKVNQARERLRAKPSAGGKSPLPNDLDQEDVYAIIRDLLGLKSPSSENESIPNTPTESISSTDAGASSGAPPPIIKPNGASNSGSTTSANGSPNGRFPKPNAQK